jgi:hypothetical protein
MFERWIKLFGDTCGELFEEPVAETFRAKATATRIAESLKFNLHCHLPAFDRLPVAGASKRPVVQEHSALLLHAVGPGWHAGAPPLRALYVATREQGARDEPDGRGQRPLNNG